MTIEEFLNGITRTVPPNTTGMDDATCDMLHGCIGMVTEVQELLKADSYTNIEEELGDILWYWGLYILGRNKLYEEDTFIKKVVAYLEKHEKQNPKLNYVMTSKQMAPWLLELSAQLTDDMKSRIYYNKAKHPDHEILSSVWLIYTYVRAAANFDLNETPSDIMDTNQRKLKARFPEKFSQKHATERDIENEYRVMEIKDRKD